MNFLNAGLYIHIPFCLAKCPYCDFFSIVADNDGTINQYLTSLQQEMKMYSQKYPALRIETIYLGGGTPTTLSGAQIAGVLESCYRYFKIDGEIEITIESNPATFDQKKADRLFSTGVNRLSLGAQSFSNRVLKKIGRIHNKQDIIASYEMARKAGFKNISLDVMYGLPGQTLRQFDKTLQEMIQLHPEHISLYGLSVEKGTPFETFIKKGLLKVPSDDIAYEMYQKAVDYLVGCGYEHYEISNFALTHYRCLHNQIYWKNQQYLGLGASSSSYIEKRRFQNYRDLGQYINLLQHDLLPIQTKEVLSLPEKMAETIILKLRMMEGMSKIDFIAQFNQSLEKVYSSQLKRLMFQGLLDENDTHYCLTKKGIALANEVFMEFLE